MVRVEGRHAICWPAPRAPRIRGVAQQRDPLLWCAPRGAPGHHRLGAGPLQVRQHAGRRQRKAPVRPVLHQECVHRFGSADYVPNHQDRFAGARRAMKWIFWGASCLIIYAYFGYAGWLWVRSRWRPRPVSRSAYTPAISIVMVVRNEATALENKLRNLLDLNYPGALVDLVVASDGSTDGTNEILSQYAKIPRVRAVFAAPSRGKAAGLNDAIAIARGDIIVFTDARQKLESDALRLLLENFADATVGCASGELMLGDPDSGET